MSLEQDALVSAPPAATEAGRILAVAHAAFGEMRGVLLALPDELLDREPSRGVWSPRQTLEHVIRVERSYRANCLYALARRDDEPVAMPAERRPAADPADTAGDVLDVVRALARRRGETDAALAGLADAALSRPTAYGPTDVTFEVDLRFRLHRFAIHLARLDAVIAEVAAGAG